VSEAPPLELRRAPQARAASIPALLLAVPFLVGIAVLKGLTVEIDTFHGSDAAVYQLPTILQLREGLEFSDYASAQTPLFHLLMAGWSKLVGLDLWKLRLLNVAISYGAALALLRLLRRTTSLGTAPAFALTLAFALSPYFFGASFTLLTDNLAILLALLALERIHRYRQDGSLAAFAAACLWIAGAVLTRQSFLWLVAVAGFFLLLGERRRLDRVALGGAALGLALVPLAALVIEWNGLVPPSADPASCGLCTDRPGVGRDALTLRTVGFTVALVGVYAGLVLGPAARRRLPPRTPLVAAAAAVGVALLLISPLEYTPIRVGLPGDAGYLWRVSDRFPSVLGSSLAFWALVPAGAVAAALLARRAGWTSLASVYLGAFLVATLPVQLVYQKYFDPFALLAVALLARPPDFERRSDYVGVALLCAGSIAYALSFAG
jgi:Dolichyl-phosphate-mannose-protein mannosyltransferase